MRYLEEIVCAVILLVMVAVTACNVATRFVPGLSFAASEELVVNLFVWLTVLGSVIAVKQKAHLAVSLVTRKIPARFQRLFLTIQCLSVFVVFVVLLYYGSTETWAEYRSGMMTYSLGLPLWLFTMALPVGSLLFLIRFSQLSRKEWKILQ